MKKFSSQAGFTLIETLIAIFLLMLTVGGLLTLAADGYFQVRYAKNQIIANSLLQESLEYIRNDRDTSFQQGVTWSDWVAKYSGDHGCFDANGCTVDPYTTIATDHVIACASDSCPAFTFYPTFGFYGYANTTYPSLYNQSAGSPYLTTYVRTITMQQASDPNQLTVTATMKWLNGNTSTSSSQSILLTNWHD